MFLQTSLGGSVPARAPNYLFKLAALKASFGEGSDKKVLLSMKEGLGAGGGTRTRMSLLNGV